jgi:exodeoxyribonuclease VII large subunit
MTLFDQLPTGGEAPRRISLVRLSGELARSVAAVGRVSVEGEVVRPRTLASGRTFFTLRDRAAQMNVTFAGARARHCRAVHGERVCVTGAVTYTPERGQLQLNAEEVTPVGAGAIAALLVEVRARLRADGLLDRPRRALPLLPRRVGVVCGADAAVRGDIESVIAARMAGYPVRFQEVNVSGVGAAESITDGLRALCADPEVDVVILARGGGDAAQLLPFSDEGLCRAICAARLPVVVAIGHEGDRPLCDEVADVRAATPSLAAARVFPSRAELDSVLVAWRERAGAAAADALRQAAHRLAMAEPVGALQAGMATAMARLDRAGARLDLLEPSRRLVESRRLLERIDRAGALRHHLTRAEGSLAERRRTLEALDPGRVLARGYAVVRDEGGAVLRDSSGISTGSRIEVVLARGGLGATVVEARPGTAS